MRKYCIDEKYFEEINTKEKAYFFGWLMSDGCILKRGFELYIVEKDNYILHAFLKSMNSDYHLYRKTFNNKKLQTQMGFKVTSLKMRGDLISLGCVPRKSLIKTFPKKEIISDELLWDFIRGYFDGNGSVSDYIRSVKNKKYTGFGFHIVSSIPFIEGMKNRINMGNSSKKHTSNSTLNINNEKDFIRFYELIYENSDLCLKRKFEKATICYKILKDKKFYYRDERIVQMDLGGNFIKIWKNIKELKASSTYNTQTILRAIRGKIKTANNYKWELYDKQH